MSPETNPKIPTVINNSIRSSLNVYLDYFTENQNANELQHDCGREQTSTNGVRHHVVHDLVLPDKHKHRYNSWNRANGTCYHTILRCSTFHYSIDPETIPDDVSQLLTHHYLTSN